MVKLLILYAYFGLLRKSELIPNLRSSDVEVKEGRVEVTIRESKHRNKYFLLADDDPVIDPVGLTLKYLKLRKPRDASDRFFLNYNQVGRAYFQNMGPNNLATIPGIMAKALGLANANDYTWHCFRRSGATQLCEAGMTIENIQRVGRWCGRKGHYERKRSEFWPSC